MYLTYHRNYGMEVHIGRFHNIFGPEGTWTGGKEKAPATISRKVANKAGQAIEIWGDGKQTHSFLYIDECLDGVRRLMDSIFIGPVNIGSEESELRDLLVRHAVIGLRYSAPVCFRLGIASYHAICNYHEYDIYLLSRQSRQNINKGLTNCTVTPTHRHDMEKRASGTYDVYKIRSRAKICVYESLEKLIKRNFECTPCL